MAKGRRTGAGSGRASAAQGAAAHPVLGALDLLLGVAMLGGIWGALPARWWPVDVLGSGLAILLGLAGAALLARTSWAGRLGTVASLLLLLPGLGVVTTLAATAGELAGLYGPVGMGAAVILGLVFLLFIPYFVVFPLAQLFFLARPAPADDATD